VKAHGRDMFVFQYLLFIVADTHITHTDYLMFI